MRAALFVCALLLVPLGVARADAIGIPADIQCPPGSAISANHAGHWCEVQRACTADTGCYDGEICSPDPVAVCADVETYTMGGRLATDVATPHSIRVGRGPCDASCTAPASCDTARRCVRRPPAPPAPVAPSASPAASTSSSSCRAAPGNRGGAGSLAAVIGLVIAALVVRRRSR
jgi:hypothetical protein